MRVGDPCQIIREGAYHCVGVERSKVIRKAQRYLAKRISNRGAVG